MVVTAAIFLLVVGLSLVGELLYAVVVYVTISINQTHIYLSCILHMAFQTLWSSVPLCL